MIARLLIHPDVQKRADLAKEILSLHKLSQNHPDLLWLDEEEKLGIERARGIKDFLSLKPYQGGSQGVVLIAAESLTVDAQNALLKTLEELTDQAIMILGASSEDQLLPTILSRCQIINVEDDSYKPHHLTDKDIKTMENLLSSSLEERFIFVEKLEDREEFVESLIIYFRNKLITNHQSLATNHFLKELIEAQRWAKHNVNIRAILEYLMLRMPKSSNW